MRTPYARATVVSHQATRGRTVNWARRWTGVVAVLCAFGCFQPTTESSNPEADGGRTRCFTSSYGFTACAEPADSRVCGDSLCVDGTQCCLATGTCSTNCDSGDGGGVLWSEGRPCGSMSDCGADEYCAGPSESCFGSGRCTPIQLCGVCSGGPERCAVCGCDAKTYESPQQACAAGVRAISGACNTPTNVSGVCVNQAQCGTGAFCCSLYSRCLRNEDAWRCEVLPDGGRPYDCRTDSDCAEQSDYPGASPGPKACIGVGCTGFGHCSLIGDRSRCSGLQKTVCGCDQQTYVNECWANAAGVRVFSEGPCN